MYSKSTASPQNISCSTTIFTTSCRPTTHPPQIEIVDWSLDYSRTANGGYRCSRRHWRCRRRTPLRVCLVVVDGGRYLRPNGRRWRDVVLPLQIILKKQRVSIIYPIYSIYAACYTFVKAVWSSQFTRSHICACKIHVASKTKDTCRRRHGITWTTKQELDKYLLLCPIQ